MVAMRLTPVMIEDVEARRIPMIHMSAPGPGLPSLSESGA
jgi:hypothetical protein